MSAFPKIFIAIPLQISLVFLFPSHSCDVTLAYSVLHQNCSISLVLFCNHAAALHRHTRATVCVCLCVYMCVASPGIPNVRVKMIKGGTNRLMRISKPLMRLSRFILSTGSVDVCRLSRAVMHFQFSKFGSQKRGLCVNTDTNQSRRLVDKCSLSISDCDFSLRVSGSSAIIKLVYSERE